MRLNDLLKEKDIDPRNVIVLRHRPKEPELRKRLPWLATEKPDFFNAYQQTQGGRLESVFESVKGRGFVISCIGNEPGKALFVGMYKIDSSRPLTFKQFWRIPAYAALRETGMKGWNNDVISRKAVLWFDMTLCDFYPEWKGKLVLGWPPPERSWWRRSHKNNIPVLAVLEDSALEASMPSWEGFVVTWDELPLLPKRWRFKLAEWRGIYFIFDSSDGRGYVGSAYGDQNLLGRWMNYAAKGDGGNRLLKHRDPRNFHFSILQRLSPDMEPNEVIQLESSWKDRLHTRHPNGLNAN